MILHLPPHFDLVVGDTFELFYRGILSSVEPSAYDLEFTWAGGKNYGNAYRKKLVFTPTEADVGTHTLGVTLIDNSGEPIERGEVEVRIHPRPKAPKEERVVLCVGASTTASGAWVSELYRRLTAEGGTPEGDGLANIRFIGNAYKRGVHFEGYGGWHFRAYSTDHRNPRFMYVHGSFSDKSEIGDQHSFYTDENDCEWKLEAITEERIKLIRVTYPGSDLPASGTLRHKSGGTNHGDIVYTSSELAEANPFWDTEGGRNDFVKYAKKHGVERIDEVLIYLGGNSTYMKEEPYKKEVRFFLDGLFEAFPQCRVILAGMAIPDRDGMGHNYGTTWRWSDKIGFIFSLAKWYADLAEEPAYRGRVEFMCLSGQFDTEHNFPHQDLPVSIRSPLTAPLGTNALHPTDVGYMQVADAFYRSIVPHFQD